MKMLAVSSRGTPRIANRILRRMRDFAQVWGTGSIDRDIVRRGLEGLEIGRMGLGGAAVVAMYCKASLS